MADFIHIDGRNYVPLSEASELARVPEAQIRALATEGKVFLRAIGTKVYVDLDGLKAALEKPAPAPVAPSPARPVSRVEGALPQERALPQSVAPAAALAPARLPESPVKGALSPYRPMLPAVVASAVAIVFAGGLGVAAWKYAPATIAFVNDAGKQIASAIGAWYAPIRNAEPARTVVDGDIQGSQSATSTNSATQSVGQSAAQTSAPTSVVNNYVTYPVIERIVESNEATYATDAARIAQLEALQKAFDARLAVVESRPISFSGPAISTPVSVAAFAPSQRIDQLSGTSLSNITVSGVSGLTDADIPDGITASNYVPLSGGTVTGTLSFTYASSTAIGANNLYATSSILTYASSTAMTAGSLYATSSILTYASSTAFTANNLFGTNASLTYASSTALTATNLFSTYWTGSYASTTAHTTTSGWATNWTATYASSTALTATNLFGTNATLTYASSTALTVSGTGYFGTASTSALTLSGFAANRVPYITTNGVVTNSANLTFDGTTLTANALALTTALTVANGGTGATSLTGLIQGNGTSAFTAITGTAGQFPYYNGSNTLLATSTIFLATTGNVGIGTTTPNGALVAQGAANTYGTLSVVSSSETGSARSFVVWNDPAATTPRFFVERGGFVGIGVSDAAYKLDVSDDTSNGIAGRFVSTNGTNSNGVSIQTQTTNSGDFGLYIAANAGSNPVMRVRNDGITLLGTLTSNGYRLEVSGDVRINGSGTTCIIGNGTSATNCSSDERLKTNIIALQGSLERIMQLEGVTFNWKDPKKSQDQYIGLLAQDVLKQFPQLVGTTTMELDNATSTYYTLDYAGLVSPLIEAVKEIATISTTFKSALLAWFADAANGIEKLIANEIVAENLHAEKLCLGETCITESELKEILESRGAHCPAAGAAAPPPPSPQQPEEPAQPQEESPAATPPPDTPPAQSEEEDQAPLPAESPAASSPQGN